MDEYSAKSIPKRLLVDDVDDVDETDDVDDKLLNNDNVLSVDALLNKLLIVAIFTTPL